MTYLVKESFTAKPRSYTLEALQSDHAGKLLAGTAMVREDRQDFWYSVAELVGATPAKEFPFACPHCRATTQAREIDVGLEVSCRECGKRVMAPDVPPKKDPEADLHLLRRGRLLFISGAAIFLGTLIFALNGHGIPIGSRILELVGACMMINGYGKCSLFHQKHPAVS